MLRRTMPDDRDWMRCQSVMQPSTAEYWHIGAITIRLASLILPTWNGVKSLAMISLSPSCVTVMANSIVEFSRNFRPTKAQWRGGLGDHQSDAAVLGPVQRNYGRVGRYGRSAKDIRPYNR